MDYFYDAFLKLNSVRHHSFFIVRKRAVVNHHSPKHLILYSTKEIIYFWVNLKVQVLQIFMRACALFEKYLRLHQYSKVPFLWDAS